MDSPADTRFPTADLNFARFWAGAAPGLGGWSLTVETTDEGAHHVEIDPPGADHALYSIALSGDHVVITQRRTCGRPDLEHVAADLPAALLIVCPLSAETLAGFKPTEGGERAA